MLRASARLVRSVCGQCTGTHRTCFPGNGVQQWSLRVCGELLLNLTRSGARTRGGARADRPERSGAGPGRVRGASGPPRRRRRRRARRAQSSPPGQRPTPRRASGRLTGAGGDGQGSPLSAAPPRPPANSGGEGRGPGRSLPAPPRPGGGTSPPSGRRAPQAPRAATRSSALLPLHYLEVPATRR